MRENNRKTGSGRWKPDSSILPDSWDIHRLKYLSDIRPSNVDKKSKDSEQDVELCNYTDVYYEDYITNKLNFMQATAPKEKIDRFLLKKGDIIITKDSESADDIGVAALVSQDFDNVICGYHLFLIRPNEQKVTPEYLYWALKSRYVSFQFQGAATGVTRVGLSTKDASDVWIPVPPLNKQSQIAESIRNNISKVGKLIQKKEQLLNVLDEKSESTIEDQLTSGLNADNDFGTKSWSIKIPDNWNLKRGRGLFYEVDEKSEDGSETLFSLRKDQGLVPHSEVSDKEYDKEDLQGYKKIEKNQLVMNRMRASTGLIGVAPSEGIVSPDYAIFETKENANPRFYQLLFQTELYKTMFMSRSMGLGTGEAGFLRLYSDRFLSLQFPHPPIDKQEQILNRIERNLEQIDNLSEKTNDSIKKLNQRQEAVITGCVTGQIDISDKPNSTQNREI